MLDRFGDGRRALSGIRHHYGAFGLDNLAVLDKYLPLMLPRAWELTAVIRAAAAHKVARQLANRIRTGVPVADAVDEVAGTLAQRAGLDRFVSMWIVTEYAAVLGHDTSGVPPPAEEPIILPSARLPTVPIPSEAAPSEAMPSEAMPSEAAPSEASPREDEGAVASAAAPTQAAARTALPGRGRHAAPRVSKTRPPKTRPEGARPADPRGLARIARRPAVVLAATAIVVAVLVLHDPSKRGEATEPVRVSTAEVCVELSDGLDTATGDAAAPAAGYGDPTDMPNMPNMPGMSGQDMVSMSAYTMTRSITASERDLFAAEAPRSIDSGLATTLSAYAKRLTTILSSAKSLTDMQKQLQAPAMDKLTTQINMYCPDLDL